MKKILYTFIFGSFLFFSQHGISQSIDKQEKLLIESCKTEFLTQLVNKNIALHTIQFTNPQVNKKFTWFQNSNSFIVSMSVSYQFNKPEPIPTFLIEAGKDFSSSQTLDSSNSKSNAQIFKTFSCEIEQNEQFFKITDIQEK